MTDDLDAIAARAYEGLDDLWLESRVEQWIAPMIAGWCEGRTLDLGYGTGVMAGALIDCAVRLDIVEGSRKLVDQAFADLYTGWGGRVIHSMFEDFDPGPVYDTVLALFVLEHVEDPVGLLERVYGWLRPGGRLIVAVPNASSVHRRVGAMLSGQPAAAVSERDLLVGHRRVYVADDLVAELAGAGYENPFLFGWFLKPVWNALMVNWAPELIDALCHLGSIGPASDAANLLVIVRKPSTGLDADPLV